MNPGRRTAPNLKMFLIPALALLLALCFSLLLLPADAHAAARTVEVEGVKKGGTVILSNGKSDKATAFEIHIKNIFDKISIRSVTPNKKGIVKINLKGATGYSDEPRWSQGCFTLTPKKAGTVKLTIKGKDDDDSTTMEANIVKANGKWFIDPLSFSEGGISLSNYTYLLNNL